MITGFDHFIILVHNLKAAAETYRALGYDARAVASILPLAVTMRSSHWEIAPTSNCSHSKTPRSPRNLFGTTA